MPLQKLLFPRRDKPRGCEGNEAFDRSFPRALSQGHPSLSQEGKQIALVPGLGLILAPDVRE